jgi:hypothetical protein
MVGFANLMIVLALGLLAILGRCSLASGMHCLCSFPEVPWARQAGPVVKSGQLMVLSDGDVTVDYEMAAHFEPLMRDDPQEISLLVERLRRERARVGELTLASSGEVPFGLVRRLAAASRAAGFAALGLAVQTGCAANGDE